MRLIISLLGIAAIVYAVAWFGYDIHPQDLNARVISSIKGAGKATSEGTNNMVEGGARFSEVIQNRYHSQDMTEPHPN